MKHVKNRVRACPPFETFLRSQTLHSWPVPNHINDKISSPPVKALN
jgi:hypothetical protein